MTLHITCPLTRYTDDITHNELTYSNYRNIHSSGDRPFCIEFPKLYSLLSRPENNEEKRTQITHQPESECGSRLPRYMILQFQWGRLNANFYYLDQNGIRGTLLLED